MATRAESPAAIAVLVTRFSGSSARCPSLPFHAPRFSNSSFSTSYKLSSECRRCQHFQVRASSEEKSGSEILTELKEKWDAIENKTNVIVYGGGAIVAVCLCSILVSAINSVPLLPKIIELIGLGYTGWFVYLYILLNTSIVSSSVKPKGTDLRI